MLFALLGTGRDLWVLYQTVSSSSWGKSKSNSQELRKKTSGFYRHLLGCFSFEFSGDSGPSEFVMTPGALLNHRCTQFVHRKRFS